MTLLCRSPRTIVHDRRTYPKEAPHGQEEEPVQSCRLARDDRSRGCRGGQRTPASRRRTDLARKVAGLVPYDFRMPTIDRVKEHLWAPDNPKILVPHVFGVGWTVNAGRVVALARGATRRG